MRPFTKNIHTCEICGNEFSVHPAVTARGGGKYCSMPCRNKGMQGERNWQWRGGRFLIRGYWNVSLPEVGRVLEHRHLMEQKLGRKLMPKERVYHTNGIKTDNTIANLSLIAPKTKIRRVSR